MRILYIGDIMGGVGLEVVAAVLPTFKQERKIDAVIAQAENVTSGKGMNLADYQKLKALGIDGFSGGNHTPTNDEINQLLLDPNVPVTGPANMPTCPGPGYKYIASPAGKILLVSLLGQIVGRNAGLPVDNPLQTIDTILQSQQAVERVATIVNFHGDFSSEKVVIGHYLDGQASAVIGDHWHVPTADARVLPAGTAHISDVGMCGALDSSLGVAYRSIVPRWRDGTQTRNILETQGRRQFNAVLIDVDNSTKLAHSIEPIRQIIE